MEERSEIQSGDRSLSLEESCAPAHLHERQQNVIRRLARIEGHVRGVKRMVEQGQPCPDILMQIAALRSALNSVGRIVLEDHLKGCMIKSFREGDFESAYQALTQSLDMLLR